MPRSPSSGTIACTIGSTYTINSSVHSRRLICSSRRSGISASLWPLTRKFWLTTLKPSIKLHLVRCMISARKTTSSRAICVAGLTPKINAASTKVRDRCHTIMRQLTMPTWPVWSSCTSWSIRRLSMCEFCHARAKKEVAELTLILVMVHSSPNSSLLVKQLELQAKKRPKLEVILKT